MWIRNLDTGKWIAQIDQTPKDYYDGLKQDLESIKLYSKCLSGAVYIDIDSFDNIYKTLNFDKIGYYISDSFANINLPQRGPQLPIDETNYSEFYSRYLKHDAFTIKNLFTPTKIINDQVENLVIVDVATTEKINDLLGLKEILYIDGLRMLEGHRILVKNQISEVTLPLSTNARDYFSQNIRVSNYYLKSSDSQSRTYFYFNDENGVYTYTNKSLSKSLDLNNYDTAYKFKVVVKYGDENHDKEFHSEVLQDFYYPIKGENIEFSEGETWLLRHRLDYNNILEINYYDILQSDAIQIYSRQENFTYSIPQRLLAVGEFGVIINNQDRLNNSSLNNNSSIINSRYKVNLRSISQTKEYYWVCGDEGTVLRISKIDFSIKRIELNLFTKLNCVTFFDNLNGFIVGDFNRIYQTSDGGNTWNQLFYPEYDEFSFNKVIFGSLVKVYIGGTNGFFAELNKSDNEWTSYKRQISKRWKDDDYLLVDDIYDLMIMKWVTINPFRFVYDDKSDDFAESLGVNVGISPDRYDALKISLDSKFFGIKNFEFSEFYFSLQIEGNDGLIYSDGGGGYGSGYGGYGGYGYGPNNYTLFHLDPDNKSYVKYIDLAKIGYLLKGDNLRFDISVFYSYDGTNDQITNFYGFKMFSFETSTIDPDFVLLTSVDKIVAYDSDNKYNFLGKNYVYLEFDRTINDIRTIDKPKNSLDDKIYIGADKVYSFDFRKISNIQNSDENIASINLTEGPSVYANRIKTYDKLYIAGNDSLLNHMEIFNVGVSNATFPWDPLFFNRFATRFLFLDYDIGSKLNFFTDQGEYRLPISFEIFGGANLNELLSAGGFMEFFPLSGETNWLTYWKDSEKTFEYYTSISQPNKIEFSSKFLYTSSNEDYTVTKNQISNNLDDILKFAPSVQDHKMSEYYQGNTPILEDTSSLIQQPQTLSNYDILVYKNIIIFKRGVNDSTLVGDILRIESDTVDANLVVNKIVYYYKVGSGPFNRVYSVPNPPAFGSVFEKYIYCYNTFNQNIVNNFITNSGTIKIRNLNRYFSADDLIEKVDLHPVGIGYKLTRVDDSIGSPRTVNISARFNNKTAYYNLASSIRTPFTTYQFRYSDLFMRFGYTPTYNISDMLSRIDSVVFNPNKVFTILPEYFNIPAATASGFTADNIQINDTQDKNKIVFGTNLEFKWQTLLKWTFVDFWSFNMNSGFEANYQLLIIDKYFDETLNGFVIEFHQQLKYPDFSSGILSVDIRSRNKLFQISSDLKTLNNIQRTVSTKTTSQNQTFTEYGNPVKFKFPTESYLKVLVSDFDIQQKVTGIVYSDYGYQLSLNIINVEKQLEFYFNAIFPSNSPNYSNKVVFSLTTTPNDEFKIGDLVYVQLTGLTGSSRDFNPQYMGFHTVIDIQGQYITTATDYGASTLVGDTGIIKFLKHDSFLNYQPIDLFGVSHDKKPKKSIEILPEMLELKGSIHNLINVNKNKYKLKFVDGLFLQEIEDKFSWFLQGETSNAVIGKNDDGLVWYSGVWRCGRWFGGTWISGEWVSGDWYEGNWYSSPVRENILDVEIGFDIGNVFSKWYGGRWFGGSWNGGSWYQGRRYGGDWYGGLWYDGIWNDGIWYGGLFQGGIWVYGRWFGGKFNCDSSYSYWLDGVFESGDFENGIWYNGQFGNQDNKLARFGTRSVNTRISEWQSGKWISGEFHSLLNIDEKTLLPTVSDVHTLSVWRTGIWLGGTFYGGVAYNIDFRSGVWEGGILEEIQVIGLDFVYPETLSKNRIWVNGIFRFNVGDEIYIIDDYKQTLFSPLGNNENIGKYRINKIEEDYANNRTGLYLNYNLSKLQPPIDFTLGSQNQMGLETGLRVVSHFVEATWNSGLWTNGYFESGTFESGMWYNGVFDGIMGR